MFVRPGRYRISSKGTGTLVGRANAEDLSLLPKRIVTGNDVNPYPWQIVPAPAGESGQYILRAVGSVVVNIGGKVFADLQDDIQDRVWVLRAQPHEGPDIFTITTPGDESLGWVASNVNGEEDAQVKVQALVVQLSEPPQVFLDGLFEVVLLSQEGS